MTQRDSQARTGRRGDIRKKRQKKTWHPRIRFKAKARICDLLRSQSSWTWLSVMLLLTLSYPGPGTALSRRRYGCDARSNAIRQPAAANEIGLSSCNPDEY